MIYAIILQNRLNTMNDIDNDFISDDSWDNAFYVSNENIDQIPNNATHVVFDDEFDKPLSVGIIPNSVTHLVFDCFTKPINVGAIPNSVTYLEFNYFEEERIKVGLIQNSVKDLYLNHFRNIKVCAITNSVTHLHL